MDNTHYYVHFIGRKFIGFGIGFSTFYGSKELYIELPFLVVSLRAPISKKAQPTKLFKIGL